MFHRYYLFTAYGTKKPTITNLHFVRTISNLMKSDPICLNPPLFIFKRYQLTAAHHAKILADHNFILEIHFGQD
jgi:hypothetical protein